MTWKILTILSLIIAIMGQLSYPLDKQSKDILRSYLSEELPSLIFDVLWNKIIYWSTFYESPDGWTLTGTPVFIGGEISMTANSGAEPNVYISKDTNNKNLLEWDKDQRMRTNFSINGVSDETALMIIGQEQAGGNILSHFGFKVSGSTLSGVCGDATTATQSSITLATIISGTNYEVEARYLYGNKINFYVDGIQKGSLSTNMPVTNNDSVFDYNPEIMELGITASAAANKTLISSFFEYIRLK